jgi:hypothetical protein
VPGLTLAATGGVSNTRGKPAGVDWWNEGNHTVVGTMRGSCVALGRAERHTGMFGLRSGSSAGRAARPAKRSTRTGGKTASKITGHRTNCACSCGDLASRTAAALHSTAPAWSSGEVSASFNTALRATPPPGPRSALQAGRHAGCGRTLRIPGLHLRRLLPHPRRPLLPLFISGGLQLNGLDLADQLGIEVNFTKIKYLRDDRRWSEPPDPVAAALSCEESDERNLPKRYKVPCPSPLLPSTAMTQGSS